MNYMGFLRPVWAWLRGDELPAELAEGFLGLPVGVPRLAGGRRRDDDAALPRPACPWHGRRSTRGRCSTATTRRASAPSPAIARAPARRRRPADDDAGRADGVGRRRARRRGRLGRGRPPADAVGPARDAGTPTCSTGYRALVALRRSCRRARARRHPLRRTSPPTRSPTCARRPASACSASPRARRTSRVRLPLAALGCAALETLLGRRRAVRRRRRRAPGGRAGVPRLETAS